MSDESYTAEFTVPRTPHQVYGAINDVRGWWEETIAGPTHEQGDEFTHWVPGVYYARIRVEQILPGKRISWRVLDNWMSFIGDQSEWKGTEIRFDLTPTDDGTHVRFTHVGLTPLDECFEVCRDAWGMYVTDSLPALITTGVGRPSTNPDEAPDGRVADLRRELAASRQGS